MTAPIRAAAWLVDGDGDVWWLDGFSEDDGVTPVYRPGEESDRTAEAIEHEYGISTRGDEVTLPEVLQ